MGLVRKVLAYSFLFFSDASNVLVISTDVSAKPEDDALIFFFRWPFIFSQMQICLDFYFNFFFGLNFREGSVVFWNVEEKTVSKVYCFFFF